MLVLKYCISVPEVSRSAVSPGGKLIRAVETAFRILPRPGD